jgi:hypothetical protein
LSTSTASSNQQINTNPSIDNTSINSYSSSTAPSSSANTTSTFITTNKILESSATINSPYITTASIALRSFNNTSNSQNMHDTSDNTFSSITDSSIRSVSSKAESICKNTSSAKSKESSIISSGKNGKTASCMTPVDNSRPQTRSTTSAGGTLKKHLNILKTNSKKVLMGSTSTTTTTAATVPSSSSSGVLSKPSVSKKPSIASSSGSPKSLNNMTGSLVSTDTISSKNSSYSLATSNAEQSQQVIDELKQEIDKLKFEVSRREEDEEAKLNQFKRIAEEKQIESAALKYEFRKLQEMKENLSAENNLFKSFLTRFAALVLNLF